MKKQLTHDEKQKKLEEQQFKKRFNQKHKLSPDMRIVSKEVGKAPACNTNHNKKEVNIATVTNKKKK